MFGAIGSTKKNLKFFKNIEKTPCRRVAQKKVQYFAPGTDNHTFILTHPVCQTITQKFASYLIGELRITTGIFLAWFSESKLSELTCIEKMSATPG